MEFVELINTIKNMNSVDGLYEQIGTAIINNQD